MTEYRGIQKISLFASQWDHSLVINTLQSPLWDQAEPTLQLNPFFCLASFPAPSCFLHFFSSLSQELSIHISHLHKDSPPQILLLGSPITDINPRSCMQSFSCILTCVSMSGRKSVAFIRFPKEFMTQKMFEISAVGDNIHFASRPPVSPTFWKIEGRGFSLTRTTL